VLTIARFRKAEVGRMPAENGLPQYVSRRGRNGPYQYYRRPPTGVVGAAFVRSFRTKDRKVMLAKYAAIHAEAEVYFDRLISGRQLSDEELIQLVGTRQNAEALFKANPGELYQRSDWDRFIDQSGTPEMRALVGPDREFLVEHLYYLYVMTEAANAELTRERYEERRDHLSRLTGSETVPTPGSGLTLMGAYEQAWLPAATRSKNTAREVKRYATDFIELNGDHAIKDLTREHWGKWRADCLEKYGANWTAFKRFTMMKTIVTEAIKAGLMERKFFEGQDVVMRKPPRNKLRNEGWSDDELKTLFGSDLFRDREADPADYWIPVIIAHTGARLSEVAGMNVPDVGQRHGMLTFYLAREEGKTEDSRRIIPIPSTITDLGFLEYLDTLPKDGPLFPRNTAYTFTKQFGRYRKRIGLNRRGCDLHAFRHHVKTLLGDLECPDRINDYITGHAPVGVAARYGKTEYQTALRFLNRIDLGVVIPKWKDS
jgi:integrase